MTALSMVRFEADDCFGLWKAGDLAEDLGPESRHPDAPAIRLLRLLRTGELLSLSERPYEHLGLTSRQCEAAKWLHARGKVSERLVREGGFTLATMDALAEAGVATRRFVGVVRPKTIYESVPTTEPEGDQR